MVQLSSSLPDAASRPDRCIDSGAQHDLRTALVAMVADVLSVRQLSQVDAARICETDQPTLSKVLAGRKQSASAEKLLCWLLALGWDVEIRLKAANGPGNATVLFDE